MRLSAPGQCVVLVGGLGTRLGALAGDGPKPMADVAGRPFLAYLLWHARRFGFRRVLLLAGHRADRISDRVDALLAAAGVAPDGLEVEVCVEPRPLGTAGALRHAAPRLEETFLLLNGDSLFDFNWLDLTASAAEGVRAVLALRRVTDASRYGVVELAGERVTRFASRGAPGPGLINGGVALLHRSVAEGCAEEGSLEGEVLPALAAAGAVRGRVHEGFFLDIGVPAALAEAQAAVPASLRRPAVFFDRDGVLNVDHGYVGSVDRLEWTPGAAAAVKAVNDRGWFAFLITNQSGVARGLFPEAAVVDLHAHMQAELRRRGAHLDDIRWCPHHPDGALAGYARACDHRKPAPGMLLDLARRWPVDLGRSLVVGDKPTDLEAGRAAGVGAGALFPGGDLAAFLQTTPVGRLPEFAAAGPRAIDGERPC